MVINSVDRMMVVITRWVFLFLNYFASCWYLYSSPVWSLVSRLPIYEENNLDGLTKTHIYFFSYM